MPVTYQTACRIFERANAHFLHEAYHAIINNVSERNWYGTMKSCLDRAKTGTGARNYHTDIEYNRNAGQLKTIMDERSEVISICCDVIFHSRGEVIEQDNLIAIEMKKTGSTDDDRSKDITRLRCLTRDSFNDTWSFDGLALPEHVCRYMLGVFYEVDIATQSAVIQYYRLGELYHEYNVSFARD